MNNNQCIYSYSRRTAREFFLDLQKNFAIHAFASNGEFPIMLINDQIVHFLEKASEDEGIMLILKSKNNAVYHQFLVLIGDHWIEVDCDNSALSLLGLSFLTVTPSQYRLPDLISETLKQCLDITSYQGSEYH